MIDTILKRFQQIDTLIQKKKTGTAAELAEKIGVSKTTIYRTIKLMKKLGAPVAYNVLTSCYYYRNEGSFVCRFSNGVNDIIIEEVQSNKLIPSIASMTEYLEILNSTIGFNNN